jgi:uncharacterized protein (DUF305 family)
MKSTFWMIGCLVLMKCQLAFPSQYDAHFLDRMLSHFKETVLISELAQLQSSNLELKRFSRKIIRHNKTEIRRMVKWRNTQYENIPEVWMFPSLDLKELARLEEEEFDLQFINQLLEHYEEGQRRLVEAQEKADRALIIHFARRNQKIFSRHINLIKEIRQDILKS